MSEASLYNDKKELEIKIIVFTPEDESDSEGILSKSDAETQLAELFNDDWGIRATSNTEDYVVLILQRAKKDDKPKTVGFLKNAASE